MNANDVITLILAGGEGTRLYPLTRERAKPAVPFGGRYRVIDFVLSNMLNSGMEQVWVLTHYKAQSMVEHLACTWPSCRVLQHACAGQRGSGPWCGGTAGALHQNLRLLHDDAPRDVAVFGADHVYKMDVSQMLDYHRGQQACATIAAIPMPLADASDYRVIEVDEQGRVLGFQEQPAQPARMPGCADHALVSMGDCICARGWLEDALQRDATEQASTHDVGRDILPRMAGSGRLFAYNFHTNAVPGLRNGHNHYWRDINSISRYYEANMDLRGVHPELNLATAQWPIRSRAPRVPPAPFVDNAAGAARGLPRAGNAIDSFVCEGCIVNGAVVDSSVLGPGVHVHGDATVLHSVLLEGVVVGPGAQVRNAIIDKHVHIQKDDMVGYDRAADERRGYTVVPHGQGNWLTVIPKETRPDISHNDE